MASDGPGKAKVATKPRKPAASKPAIQKQAEEATQMPAEQAVEPQAEKAAIEVAAAGEVAAEQLMPAPAQLAETIEAVTSPADLSDAIEAPSIETIDPAPASEEPIDMATIASNEATDKAQAVFGEFSNRFKTAFEKSSKLGEEMVEFAKGNVEAVIASARVAAKAGEALGQEAAEYGKKNFETATAAFKSFATVKSPTELFQLQSEFAKASFDSAVAEASRVSETLMKVAGEIAQPLSNRYAIAAEKIKSASV
ncbi:MAG: phasin family protein [Sphingomonas sp.]|nr:phasin family protein [Sphingomonas sp.]